MSLPRSLLAFLESGHLPHACLFSGLTSSQLEKKASTFISRLFPKEDQRKLETGNHPDVYFLRPAGAVHMHSIASIRQLIGDISLSPSEGEWKVIVITEAERMLPTSGNALLKTLEEPPIKTLFLLLTPRHEKILPPLRSRCQLILFPQEETITTELNSCILSILSEQKPLAALEKLGLEIEKSSELQDLFFKTILYSFRDRTLISITEESQCLYFREHKALIQMLPLLPMEKVEKLIGEMKLGLERSMKLLYCFEILLLRFKLVSQDHS